jgi:tetratricopeptide (TPR) repeat protein
MVQRHKELTTKNQLVMKIKSKLSPFIVGVALLTWHNSAAQSQQSSLYSGVTQSNSKYVSQFVPGLADAVSKYSTNADARYRQNVNSWKTLVSSVNNLIINTPDFDKESAKLWQSYFDQLSEYNDNHTDYENSGQWLNDFITSLNNSITLYNNRLPGKFNDQGVVEYNNKNYDKALIFFSTALQLSPTYELVFKNKAKTYSQLARYDLALADYNSYFGYGNQVSGDYNSRGVIKFGLKDYLGAVADFTKAIEIDPNNIHFYTNRADAYDQLRNWTNSISDYTRALETNPNTYDLYLKRAEVKEELKDNFGAVADYSKAITLKPADPDAYAERGRVKILLKQYKSASDDFSKAIQGAGNDKWPFRYRAELKLELHDYKGCIEDCNEVIKSSPEDAPNAYFIRGKAYHFLGNKTKACEDWSKSGEQGNNEAYEYISKYCK